MIAELFQQEVVILPLCSGIYPKNQFSALHSNINSNNVLVNHSKIIFCIINSENEKKKFRMIKIVKVLPTKHNVA